MLCVHMFEFFYGVMLHINGNATLLEDAMMIAICMMQKKFPAGEDNNNSAEENVDAFWLMNCQTC